MRRIFVALFCGSVVLAEPLALSLKQAVTIALSPEGNARVQLANEAVRIAESRSAQARAALLPNVDGAAGYQSFTRNLAAFGVSLPSLPPPLDVFRIPSLVGPIDVLDARLNASQTIFDFGTIRRYQSAKAAIRAAKAEAEGTRDQVAEQVARAYLNALRAESAVVTAEANLRLSEELVRLAHSQKNAGTGTGIEVTRANVQLANDRQRLEVARNDLDIARLNLLRLIGLELDGALELTDKLPYEPLADTRPDEAVQAALANRAELRSQAQRETSARLNYSAARWERLPSVVAAGDYGSIGTGAGPLLPTRAVGVSVRVPLFDGGRRDARRAEALALYRQEQIRARDTRRQIEFEVRQALESVRSAQAQVAAAREGLTLAEQELAQARRRYEAGVTTSVEVTDAQTRLQRARDNNVTALFNHNLARISLSSATGVIQEFVNR